MKVTQRTRNAEAPKETVSSPKGKTALLVVKPATHQPTTVRPMNSLTRTSATNTNTNTTAALGTPCQAPLPNWADNMYSIWDDKEVSLGEIVIDATGTDAKSDCMLAAIKRDHEPTLVTRAASFEPFWDPNEASLDSIIDESDTAAAARAEIDFAKMFPGDDEQNKAEIAPAASESQQAIGVPAKAQREYYNYDSKVCATRLDAGAATDSRALT